MAGGLRHSEELLSSCHVLCAGKIIYIELFIFFRLRESLHVLCSYLKKNLNASRASEHPPVRGENGKKDKTS